MSKKHSSKPEHRHGPEYHEPSANHGGSEPGMVYTVRIQPNADEENRYTEEKEFRQKQLDGAKWLNRISAAGAGIAFLALIAASIYGLIAKGQLKEMRKATDAAITQTQLLSAQLKGTMSATVRLEEPRITPDPVTQEVTLIIQFTNGGHIIAPKTNVVFRIETLSFPDLKVVLNSRAEMLTINELAAGGSSGKNYTVHDFPEPERNFISQTKTIRVSGTFSYDNGFGDRFEEPICHAYIGRANIKNEGIAGSTGVGDGFYPCDRFNELVSYILKHPWK